MIFRSRPWRLKSRLGEQSPPAWTRYIKASDNPRRRVLLAELRFQPPSKKVLAVNQLIYMGLQAWLKKAKPLSTPEFATRTHWQTYYQGVVTNVLNPKITIFFLAFLPQFVDPATSLGPLPFLLLGILFVIGCTVWGLLLAGFAGIATTKVRDNKKFSGWLARITGSVYIVLGLNLLRSKSQPI